MMRKKSIFFILLGLLVFGIILSWPDFIKGYKKGYEKAFIPSFKRSFIKSCQGLNPSIERTSLCQCAVDQAISQLTVQQLQDQTFTIEYIKKNIISACRENFKNSPKTQTA